MGNPTKSFIIGSRGSRLALVQAEWVKAQLQARHSELEVVIEIIKTSGDEGQNPTVGPSGRKGLYTSEIEQELANGRIRCAVHSMKDVPSQLEAGFSIAAIPKREDPRDVFVSKKYSELLALPKNSCVGTSSLRRMTQLKNLRPDLEVLPLRGNIETRLKKLESEDFDGIILAAAGLKRLGLASEITEALAPTIMVPSAGQGALALEVRADDDEAHTLVGFLNDPDSSLAVRAERACLRRLQGGCEVPITAYAAVEWNRLEIVSLVATPDGREVLRDRLEGDLQYPEETGEKLAEALLKQGAGRIIAQIMAHVQKR